MQHRTIPPAQLRGASARQRPSLRSPTDSGSFPSALALAGSVIILALFGWGPNFGLALAAVIVLIVGAWLCWRPGEPAIVLVVFVYQWVQASIAIFVANLRGVPIDDTAELSFSSMGQATFLSLFGLLTVVAAFRLAAGRSRTAVIQRAAESALRLSVRTLLIAYVLSLIGAIVLGYMATLYAGLAQPLRAFLSFKDAVFFIVAYVGFKRGGDFRTLFYGAFAFEFITSLSSYFSSFQVVFIYTFVAMFAAGVRLRAGQLLGAGVLAAVVIFMGVVWSAVKIDYRNHLNSGTGQQVVNVSLNDAVRTLANMVLSVDSIQLAVGADRLVRRLTYVEFFGAAIIHVPAVQEHTEGKLWWDAVVQPFTPRLFFPDKPALDSSVQTTTYTGVRVSGREQGTQISIGYIGESYIDFGTWGMFFPLALYGAAAGYLYRKVLSLRKFAGLLSMGLCVPLMMGGFYLSAEATKMVGHLTITALAIFTVHAVAGDAIRTVLLGKTTSSRRLPT